MNRSVQHSPAVRYGFALLAVALATAFEYATWPLLRPTPTTTHLLVVALSSWFGGLGPGLLATLLSALACAYLFLEPDASFGVLDSTVVVVTVFSIVAVLIASISRAQSLAERRTLEILERITDAFFALDRDWRFTYVNRRAAEFFDRPASELVGTKYWEVIPPQTVSTIAERLRQAVEQGEPTSFEAPSALRPGHWVEVHAYPSADGLSVYFRDITDRKAVEEGLNRREQELRLVTDAVPALISYIDSELQYRYMNVRHEEWFNCQRAEVLGKHVSEVLGEEAFQVLRPHFEQTLQGEVVQYEQWVPYKSGGRHIRAHYVPDRDGAGAGAGQVRGMFVLVHDVTEHRRAELALRESEARFRLMADSAPVLIWMADEHNRGTWFNRPWLDFTGRPLDDELGEGWAELIHPEDLPECIATCRAAFNARRPFTMEFRLRRHDGQYRWILDTGVPLHDAEGRFTGYIGSCIDINDRKAAEGRQALLVEAGRVLGASLDYESTLSDVARLVVPEFADWCALDLLDENGQIRRLAVAHRDPAKVELANELRRRYPIRPTDQHGVPNVMRTGEPELYPQIPDELLVRAAHDEEHLALLRALGIHSAIIVPLKARGRILGAMTLVLTESPRSFGEEDLHVAQTLVSRAAMAVDNARLFSEVEEASRRREEALALHRAVEEQLTLLVEASGGLSTSLDLESVLAAILALSRRLVEADAYAVWRYHAANGQWGIAHASGLSEEYRQSSIRVVENTPRMPETPIIAEDVLDAPILGEREEQYRREGIRSMLVVPLVVRGETSGTLVFYYRTPHQFNEVEVRVATALANLAASAIGTAELYGELKANDLRKDEFLAMLAHELRNPVAAVGNAVHLIQHPAVTEEDLKWSVGVINRQSRHLARLIDDLLDISRITRGKIELRKRVIDLSTVLDSAVEAVRPMIEQRRHALKRDYPTGTLFVEADPTRLEQMVVNLLTNAVKYTDAGGTIQLNAARQDVEVLIRVRDNGSGIAPELLPKMFELFAQGDRSLARSEGGLGIGLTLVRSLSELHGGRVTARSDGPGKGSEFTIGLPAVPALDTVRDAARTTSSTLHNSQGALVLIVDDNRDAARSLGKLLRRSGHRVELAYDGPSAVEAALESRPQYILLDIGLPGMDGYEVARRLRTDGLCQPVIIGISGYGREEDRRRSERAGFDHHLVKPFDYDQLLTLLRNDPPTQ